eukprot:5376297-Amphidinium_carterae.1
MHPDDPANQYMGKGRMASRALMPNQWADRIASKAMPRPSFPNAGQWCKGKGVGKGRVQGN